MQKYLFLDRRILSPQGMENVEIKITKAQKDKSNEVLFTEEEPWEVRIDNGYPNVIYDSKDKVYRCYYTLFIHDPDSKEVPKEKRAGRNYNPRSDREPALAYAESKDGISFIKPRLGIVEWNNTKENNLLFPYAHGTGVMLDEKEKNPEKRYKMVTKVDKPGTGAFMAVSFSADGIHWKDLIPWPKYNPPADSHNLPFWNEEEKKYNLISRVWKDGIRVTTFSESDDFINWSEPKETLRGSGFERQIYSMPVFKWEGLYLGLASVIHEGDRNEKDFDHVDSELTWAVTPKKFDWVVQGESLIKRGEGNYPNGEPDCGCIYLSPPVDIGENNLYLYYMGGNGQHTNFRETSLMRAFWRKDCFAAYETKDKSKMGVLSTSKLKLYGNNLELLVELEKMGEEYCLEVMLCPNWNLPAYKGFSYEDSNIIESENGWKTITFSNSLDELIGREISIKVRFKNFRIWALQGDVRLESHRLWEGAGEISLL